MKIEFLGKMPGNSKQNSGNARNRKQAKKRENSPNFHLNSSFNGSQETFIWKKLHNP
jgi:hypothetical protein